MPISEKDLQLRQMHKFHLIRNPNHFGNLNQLKLPGMPKAVLNIAGNTSFEDLTCIGLNPSTDILTAIVEVKQGAGYSGDSCTEGSREYVRFYLDYGNGVWVDAGVASFAAHDLKFKNDLCYAVSVKLTPELRRCCDAAPVTPMVRGILSWNIEPPANMPNWLPVWGRQLDRHVQLAPRNWWHCHIFDKFEAAGIKQLDASVLAILKDKLSEVALNPQPLPPLSELVEKIDRKDTEAVMRAVWPIMSKLANDKTDIAAYDALKSLKLFDIDPAIFDGFLDVPKSNKTFEELSCVGLDRDQNLLHGIVHIKRPNGYSGGLCTNGSREYIAFYLDFGSGWEYQGTTWVDVHDITKLPKDGLWYQASLPVNLSEHRKKWCETGQAKIRGILSWAVPPAPNQPNFVPYWGDREDCAIEIRPWPKGHTGTLDTPFIETIGNVPVDQINGLGFANGPSVGGTFHADDSPFGGTINIAGQVAFPSSNNLEYRVMVKGPSDIVHKPWSKSFGVTVTTIFGGSISFSNVLQIANGDWFKYIPQYGPVFKSVAGDLLAPFGASEEGAHSVYIQVREIGTLPVLASSLTNAFFVDNSAPVVDIQITSGGGNCSKFNIGEVLVGTYSMSDLHSSSLGISVSPGAEAAGGHLAIPTVVPAGLLPAPVPGPSASNGLSVAAFTMQTSGAHGTWELDTTGMKACGYNINLNAYDRTIVNSGYVGWHAPSVRGFCLLK